MKFCTVDRTGLIPVEVLEDTLPVLDVFPESRELRRKCERSGKGDFLGVRTNFVESDGSAAVGIENGHQEFASVEIEGCVEWVSALLRIIQIR